MVSGETLRQKRAATAHRPQKYNHLLTRNGNQNTVTKSVTFYHVKQGEVKLGAEKMRNYRARAAKLILPLGAPHKVLKS